MKLLTIQASEIKMRKISKDDKPELYQQPDVVWNHTKDREITIQCPRPELDQTWYKFCMLTEQIGNHYLDKMEFFSNGLTITIKAKNQPLREWTKFLSSATFEFEVIHMETKDYQAPNRWTYR